MTKINPADYEEYEGKIRKPKGAKPKHVVHGASNRRNNAAMRIQKQKRQ